MSCSKCGCRYTPKYKRMKLRKTGKRTLSTATYCILCHREDQRVREERRYDKKLAYNRRWRKDNRDKVNSYERKLYWKNRGWGDPQTVGQSYTVEPSRLTYT